jgi:hypothetical protein
MTAPAVGIVFVVIVAIFTQVGFFAYGVFAGENLQQISAGQWHWLSDLPLYALVDPNFSLWPGEAETVTIVHGLTVISAAGCST